MDERHESKATGTPLGEDIVSDEELAALNMERTVMGEAPEDTANRIFREAAPGAALSIVNMAMRDPNSRVRLTASTYVVDRVLGRPGEGDAAEDPLAKFLRTVEQHAQKG